ncbi:MAG: hypothetical protein ACLT5P_10605 [Flavonifractor plautii]
MNLTRLAGNAPLKRQLELETARRGLSHAYILSGPAGSGKRTLAGLLAAALVCDRRGGALPCLSCAGCRKAEGGIHPDIVRVGDDGKDISVQVAPSAPTLTSGPTRPNARSTSWRTPRP